MIAHAETVTALNAEGVKDKKIAEVLGLSRERIRQIRNKLDIPTLPRMIHCSNCGAAFKRAEGESKVKCPRHRQEPPREIVAPITKELSKDPKAVDARNRGALRKQQGLCRSGTCPLPLRVPAAAYCLKHTLLLRAKAAIRIAARKAAGQCRECKAPSAEGHVFCQEHLDRRTWGAREKAKES